MTELHATKTGLSSSAKTAVGRLFVLELSGNRIHSMNLDGSDRRTIVTDCHLPDGIVVDAKSGPIDLPKDESPANRSDIEVLFDQRTQKRPRARLTSTRTSLRICLPRKRRLERNVADARLLQNRACAARLEQTRMAGGLRALYRKGVR